MVVPLVAVAVATHPCRAALPRGPAVPAAIVLRTSCGAFRLDRDGRVTRLPRRWLARHSGGTGRRYGADLQLRPARTGRVVVLRHGRLVWRSTGLYPRDGGDVAFGPHELAFASYRRGVFLTDLDGPERLVVRGRGLYPFGFLRSGELLVTSSRSIAVVSRDGAILRRYRYRPRHGFTFDDRTDTLFFVTRQGVLAQARGPRLRLVGRLRGIDGSMSFASPGRLVFSGRADLVVTRRDGSVVARARWSRSSRLVLDAGVSVSPDGRAFAFRLSNARPGSRSGRAVVYVLRAGETRPHAIYRHRLGPSDCAVGASLGWRGRFLLYGSTDGRLAVLDSRDGGSLDLGRLGRALPHRFRGDRPAASWA